MDGGVVDLSGVTHMLDSESGDNRRRSILVTGFDVIDRVAEGARRALFDRIDNLLGRCPVRIDPGLFTLPEYRLEPVGAMSRM